jgi:hypothetical protein
MTENEIAMKSAVKIYVDRSDRGYNPPVAPLQENHPTTSSDYFDDHHSGIQDIKCREFAQSWY